MPVNPGVQSWSAQAVVRANCIVASADCIVACASILTGIKGTFIDIEFTVNWIAQAVVRTECVVASA